MSDIVHTEVYKGYTINVIHDDDPSDPRKDSDNLGTIVTWHRRYTLGDEQPKVDSEEWFNNFAEEHGKKFVRLPVNMYDHSGISLSTSVEYPFNDRWDAGQVGWIYVTYEKLKKEMGWKYITAKRVELTKAMLRQEIETYNDYVSSNCYGFKVVGPDGEEKESCWGFLGDYNSYLLQEAKAQVDFLERTALPLFEKAGLLI